MEDRDQIWRLSLVALTLVLVLQAARVLFPILFDFGEEGGRFLLAGGLAAVIFLAPLLTPVLLRFLGLRASVVVGVVVLVALRLLLQVIHPVPFWLAATATVAGLVALTAEVVALRSLGAAGGRDLVRGVLVALPVDAALRGASLSWDLAWQDGSLPLLLTLVLSAAAVRSAVAVASVLTPRREGSLRASLPLAALGPYLMLQVLLLQNVAFVSSAARLTLPAATAVVLLGDALALLVGGWLAARSVPPSVGPAAGIALVVATYVLRDSTGALTASLVVAAQALAAGLLALALTRLGRDAHRAGWRMSTAFALGSLGFALLLVLYQIHYVIPLPFPNRLVPAFAAVVLTLGAVGRRPTPVSSGPGIGAVKLAAAPLLLLLVPTVVQLTGPPVAPAAESRQSFRLVDLNARLGVNVDGQVDPEGTARAIEGQRPDVVLLQEVGRGWPINGTLDLAEWLSRRLRMRYTFAPAADGQFGNAVFSRFPILDTESGFLPFGAGPQRRSYLMAELDLGGGRSVTVVSVHLQNAEGTSIRREQILSLTTAVGSGPNTIIGGDMNMQPDEADLTLFQEAGFVSVQDLAGLGHVSTAYQPKVFPVDRVNWIFATRDLGFTDFAVVRSSASDHLPLAVTVAL